MSQDGMKDGMEGERKGESERGEGWHNAGQASSAGQLTALVLPGWPGQSGWPMLLGPPSVLIRSEKPSSHPSQVTPLRGASLYLPHTLNMLVTILDCR